MALRAEGAQGETQVFRAQVTEVDTPITAKVTLSPEAAGKLRKEEHVHPGPAGAVRPRRSSRRCRASSPRRQSGGGGP